MKERERCNRVLQRDADSKPPQRDAKRPQEMQNYLAITRTLLKHDLLVTLVYNLVLNGGMNWV